VRVALDAVHPDDGEHHVMPDARPLLGGKKVPGAGGEELAGRGGLLSCGIGDVDDRLDPGQRGVQARSGGDVGPR
jgi:hypothetical protein